MITARGESFKIKVYKRKPNTPYEWETMPYVTFFGRPANNKEKKNYRIQQGVMGNSESLFIFATNMPKEIDIKDMVIFNGSEYTVDSIGYYYDDSRMVNNHIMSDEYIEKRCPKGITLQ